MMSHGPSREWGDLKTQQIMDSISNLQGARAETPEERRKRELDAYLRQGSQISYGVLAPKTNVVRDKLMSHGVSKPWATAGQSVDRFIDMTKGKVPALNFDSGGKLFTNIWNPGVKIELPMNIGG